MSDTFALLENKSPISARDAAYGPVLRDLQCNILSPHGKHRARYYSIRFRKSAQSPEPTAIDILKAKYILSMLPRSPAERQLVYSSEGRRNVNLDLVPDLVRVAITESQGTGFLATDAELEALSAIRIRAECDSLAHREASCETDFEDKGHFAVNLMLSAKGYRELGLEPPSDPAFRAGMASRAKKLEDLPHEEYRDLDALLIVSYSQRRSTSNVVAAQEAALATLEQFLGRVVDLVAVDRGEMLRVSNGQRSWPIEPFGFRDTISQPVFYQEDLQRRIEKGLEAPVDAREWDPSAPLSLVLRPDPYGKTKDACGSYFVFRKLSQNIGEFYRRAAAAKRPDETDLDAAARLVGRKLDGTPLAGKQLTLNDFDLKSDSSGAQCPFSAHVRRSNPRGDVKEIYGARKHRIVRRAIPYGPAIKRADSGEPKLHEGAVQFEGEPADKDIGLLFLCAQSNIGEQFEHIQANWLNNPNFPPGRLPGPDPLARGNATLTARDGIALVTCHGGEYLYAPSISFLRGLIDDIWI